MDFLAVDWLWALLFVPAVAALSLYASRRRVRILSRLLGPRAADSDYVNVSKPRRALKAWLFAAATFFLVVAVARPYWGNRLLPFTGKGRDVLLVLDVSKSMMSTDMAGGGGKGAPSRLKHAKWLLRELIAATPGDRYGIIVFAGKAFLECPLTGDRTSLYNILNDITTDSVPAGGTNIEEALSVALRAFQAAAGGYKAVVLISDGDEVYGQSSNAMAEVKRLKIPLLVVGVGDPERGIIRIPDEKGAMHTVLDAQGNPVNSKLNETLLRKMAVETDGVYVRSTSAEPGLDTLEKRIEQLVPEKYAEGKMTRPLERFHLPLFAAILLYLLWLGVGETTFPSKTAAKAIALALAFLGLFAADGAQAQDSPVSDGPALTKKTPSPDAIGSFNAGLDAQQLGDSEKAEKCYTDAINLGESKPDVRAAAYQNLGVMRHQSARLAAPQEPERALKDLDQAEELYRESMRSSPGRRQVAVNQQLLLSDRKAAQEIIKRRQEMEKKQKEAQEKTQQALDQQRQANQSQGQQQKRQQQQADQKTHDAKQAAEDLAQAAKDAGKPQESQRAAQAAKDLDNARQDQKKNDGKAAEKQLEKAMQKLGGEQSQQQREENKRKDAEDKTQQAMQKQQEANQAQDQQEKQEKQQQAQERTDEAKKSMNDYQKANQGNPDPKRKENAQEAKKELEKAKEEQKEGKGEKAEDSLKKALEKLRANKLEDKQNKGDKDKQDKEDKAESKDKQDKAQKQQGQEGKPQGQRKYDEKEIDPQQAARLLDLMAKEEKSLREELKQRAKENSGVAPVEKDW